MPAMEEAKTYPGSCHCGGVRFEVTTKLEGTVTCNCSMCGRMGWVLNFVPGDAFKLVQGEELLTDYQFAKKHIHHTFCSRCGVRPFSRGQNPEGGETVAVNLRCVEGVDVAALSPHAYDGASM